MLDRGIYYEGWKPADKPLKERKKEAFLAHISGSLWDSVIDAEQVVRAVFHVLTDHMTTGEIEGIKHCEIRSLWP